MVDQATVYCTLEYLDKDAANEFIYIWKSFITDKPNLSFEKSQMAFIAEMAAIKK